jgi:hypothetical protein
VPKEFPEMMLYTRNELEEPKEMRRRNARARLFVVHEAGVKSDDIKIYDRGRRKRHTHTHILAS